MRLDRLHGDRMVVVQNVGPKIVLKNTEKLGSSLV